MQQQYIQQQQILYQHYISQQINNITNNKIDSYSSSLPFLSFLNSSLSLGPPSSPSLPLPLPPTPPYSLISSKLIDHFIVCKNLSDVSKIKNKDIKDNNKIIFTY